MKTVTGNTYPVKDQLKALGGKWNKDAKAWEVPDDKYDQALAIVAKAPQPFPRRGGYRGHIRFAPRGTFAPGGRRCPECGSRECAKAWDHHDLCDQD